MQQFHNIVQNLFKRFKVEGDLFFFVFFYYINKILCIFHQHNYATFCIGTIEINALVKQLKSF